MYVVSMSDRPVLYNVYLPQGIIAHQLRVDVEEHLRMLQKNPVELSDAPRYLLR
jgi:hypothetical protein